MSSSSGRWEDVTPVATMTWQRRQSYRNLSSTVKLRKVLRRTQQVSPAPRLDWQPRRPKKKEGAKGSLPWQPSCRHVLTPTFIMSFRCQKFFLLLPFAAPRRTALSWRAVMKTNALSASSIETVIVSRCLPTHRAVLNCNKDGATCLCKRFFFSAVARLCCLKSDTNELAFRSHASFFVAFEWARI